jgi:hypothetical protein
MQAPSHTGGCRSKSMASLIPGFGAKWRHHICNNNKESAEKKSACIIPSCLPLLLRILKISFSPEPCNLNILEIRRLVSALFQLKFMITFCCGSGVW